MPLFDDPLSESAPGAAPPAERPARRARPSGRRRRRGVLAAAAVGVLLPALPLASQVSAAGPAEAGGTAYGAAALATRGYWMLRTDGVVYRFGDAPELGNGPTRAAEAVKIEPHPGGQGYYLLYADGSVQTRGTATRRDGTGSAAGRQDALTLLQAGETATSISVHPSGNGYWIFTSRGRVFTFGNAPFLNDIPGVLSVPLNGPVLDSVATPSGNGYYMVGSDGGVFTFGDARFAGSVPEVLPGVTLNAPVQSLVPDPDGDGYWLVAADGGVFSFRAPFRGSLPGVIPGGRPSQPITGMVSSADGYIMVGEDGGAFVFPVGGSTPFFGSLGDNPPPLPITSLAAYTIDVPAPPPPTTSTTSSTTSTTAAPTTTVPPAPGTPATATATVTRGVTDTITVTWSAVAGATEYVVSGFLDGDRVVTGTSVSVPMPLPSSQAQTTYSFTITVRARNAGGTSAPRTASGPSRCAFSQPSGTQIAANTPLSFAPEETYCVGTLASDPRNPGAGPSVHPGWYRVRSSVPAGETRCRVVRTDSSGIRPTLENHGPVIIRILGTDRDVEVRACATPLVNDLSPPPGWTSPAIGGAEFGAGMYFGPAIDGILPATYTAGGVGSRAAQVELPVGDYTPVPQFPVPPSGIQRCYWALKLDFIDDEAPVKRTIVNDTDDPGDDGFIPFGVGSWVVGADLDFRLPIAAENGPPIRSAPVNEIGVCRFQRTG